MTPNDLDDVQGAMAKPRANPCPFCGYDVIGPVQDEDGGWADQCKQCWGTGPTKRGPAQARQAWNTRNARAAGGSDA